MLILSTHILTHSLTPCWTCTMMTCSMEEEHLQSRPASIQQLYQQLFFHREGSRITMKRITMKRMMKRITMKRMMTRLMKRMMTTRTKTRACQTNRKPVSLLPTWDKGLPLPTCPFRTLVAVRGYPQLDQRRQLSLVDISSLRRQLVGSDASEVASAFMQSISNMQTTSCDPSQLLPAHPLTL